MTQAERPTGKYYEELNIGDHWVTQRRTVTETDLVNFTSFSWDIHPAHTDAEYARAQFGRRLFHGPGIFSMATGLEMALGIKRGTSIVMLAINNWNMKAPVFVDDTIYVKETVAAKRETSKSDRGIITFHLQILNQKDEVCQEGDWLVMFHRIPK
jgi:acyl dehydratase